MNEELLGDGGGVRVPAIGSVVDLYVRDAIRLHGDLAQQYDVQDPIGEGAAGGLLQDELGHAVTHLVLADFEPRSGPHGA